MDPVSIIVAAVVAGAAAGVTDSIKGEVKAAYSALRTRLLARFGTSVLFTNALEDIEGEPTERNKQGLTESLAGKGITADDELVGLAGRVVEDSGLSVTQLLDYAEGASVKASGVSVEGASEDTRATIEQEHRFGKNARVEDSGVRIVYRPSSGD